MTMMAIVLAALFISLASVCGVKWSPLWSADSNASKPAPREGSILQVVHDTAFIYGGLGNATYFRDTWKFDLRQREWTALPKQAHSPGYRFDHVAITHGSFIYVFGGTLANSSSSLNVGFLQTNDVWKLNTDTSAWSQVFSMSKESPRPRTEASAVVALDGMVVFGGVVLANTVPSDFNDVWHFNCTSETWTVVKPIESSVLPPSRFSHAATTVVGMLAAKFTGDSSGNVVNNMTTMVVFSGRRVVRNGWSILNDAWMLPLDGDNKSWTKLTMSSSFSRIFAGAVTIDTRVWLFGGFGFYSSSEREGLAFADTVATSTANLPQITLYYDYEPPEFDSAPNARFHHALAVWNGSLVVFGGKFFELLGDLWLRNTSDVSTTLNPFESNAFHTAVAVALAIFWIVTCLAYLFLFFLRLWFHPVRPSHSSQAHATAGPCQNPLAGGTASWFIAERDLSSVQARLGTLGSFQHKELPGACCSLCLEKARSSTNAARFASSVDFAGGDQLRELSCCHLYHPMCIDEWLAKNQVRHHIAKRINSQLDVSIVQTQHAGLS
ncbi:hypothetical protein Ae201684_003480 [Aphanomyces euteiches]|uniref:RING-type domain-containing protein n=1 Tax=Aphanomyces euteiches TaxID=100861 RepID=A0A6G0XME3_9STRA|nr:hypothetical protein Ae201684_003480 [Aphanomyces euteiches]